MKRIIRGVRKLLVVVIGLPVLALGLVLIPLPGPGILVTLVGLFILSLEFDRAERYFNRIKEDFSKLIKSVREKT